MEGGVTRGQYRHYKRKFTDIFEYVNFNRLKAGLERLILSLLLQYYVCMDVDGFNGCQ